MSVQHYLTMLGSTVLIPFLIVPPMGGDSPFAMLDQSCMPYCKYSAVMSP